MIESDRLYRFSFERMPVRGAIVHLSEAWSAVRTRNESPEAAETLLGESVAACTLMGSSVKIRGQIELQLKGEGPLRLLLAHATSEGRVRGIVDGDLEELGEQYSFSRLVEDATLAITIEQTDSGRRYQGIVPPGGDSLAQALEGYFRQSEQLPTRLWLGSDKVHAAGLLLQRLPGSAVDEDGWNRVVSLAETLTPQELVSLPGPEILRRLFHREMISVATPTRLTFGCRCSRQKVIEVLQSIGQAEVMTAAEDDGSLEVNCEFCNEVYRFDPIDLSHLFHGASAADGSQTRQ